MTNSITFPLERPDGTAREIIIQAEHSEETDYGLEHAQAFSIWSSRTIRIGYIMFSKDKSYWKFEGQLNDSEQHKIAEFLQSFKESDWEL